MILEHLIISISLFVAGFCVGVLVNQFCKDLSGEPGRERRREINRK